MNENEISNKVTVDYLLDSVDFAFAGYVPSAVAFEFFSFIRLCLGEEPENSNPLAHYFLIDVIFQQDSVKYFFDTRGIPYDELKGRTAVLCTREFSKALTLDTKIPTPTGFTTMGDIQVGDEVYDRNGVITKVTNKSNMFLKPTYKMTLEDGRELVMSEDHDNIVWTRTNKRIKGTKVQIGGVAERVMTAKELYEKGLFWSRTISEKQKKSTEYRYFIPKALKAIDRPDTDYPLDAYTTGVLLGDGNISKDTGFSRITTHVNNYEDIVKHIPYPIGTVNKSKKNIYFFSVLGIGSLVKEHIGVANVYHKRVPYKLMVGSYKQRLDVLQGLMDTDGSINKKGSAYFCTVSEGLAKDVQELVWSLGGTAKISERVTDSPFGKAYSVMIRINERLFRLPYKADRQIYVGARDKVGIVSVELIHTQPTKCITVDSPTKSFLAGDYVVTHNSTLIGTYLPLFMAWKGEIPGYGKVNYGLYIGDSMRNNVKTTMNTIETVYFESTWLQDQFEAFRFTDEVVELIRHPRTNKEIAVFNRSMSQGKKKEQVPGRAKRKFAVKGVGALTGTRGTRSGLQRPQFAIFDDLVPSETDANSSIILGNIDSTIDSDVLQALHGAGSFAVIIGTPYNKKDPVYKRIESGAWVPVVFPIAKEINPELPKSEFKGVWEDRHSYEKVMKRYKDAVKENKLRSFMQELMLRISNEEDRLIPDDYIVWYKRSTILENRSKYNWYISTDFTTSGGKGNDFSGAAVWAINNNGDLMLVDLVLKKMELEEQYSTLFKLVRNYNKNNQHIEVGVEVDGQQKTHLFSLRERMNRLGEYFTFARQKGRKDEGILSRAVKGGKHDRFMLTLPLWQAKKIWLPEELKGTPAMVELLEELRYVTYEGIGSIHDDGLDLISQMVLMETVAPSDTRSSTFHYDAKNELFYEYEEEDSFNGNNSTIF